MRYLEVKLAEKENRTVVNRTSEEGGIGSYCLMTVKFSFGMMEKMVMVAQQCECM